MDQELSTPFTAGPTPVPVDPHLERLAGDLAGSPALRSARELLEVTDQRTVREQCELSSIPAPPFGEAQRAERMARLMADSGLHDVHRDEEGNVLGRLPGPEGPAIVVAAHLDTVFPAGTDVAVRRDEDRILGPGISDNARGLAALLALARALGADALEPGCPLLFVATVGEEGTGDLRGARHLLRAGGPGDGARGFISLDGAGLGRIVTTGLGSVRYRITVSGPGGHSWVDWGIPNPIHALGHFASAVTRIDLPVRPTTSLTVARWGGGTSINAIPQEAWIEMEVRSEGREVLEEMEQEVLRLADLHVARTNESASREGRPVAVDLTCIGRRPAGATDVNATLVRAAAAATRAVGAHPEYAVSSTDANVAMSLGIPALTMGAGGEAGKAHTTEEWYRNVGGPAGVLRALLTVLLASRS